MINAKHLATFIMGAAAGVALNKYLQTEEGQKTLDNLKAQATDLKGQAENAVQNAPAYFEKLKTEGAAALKDHFPDAEKFLHDLMNGVTPATEAPKA
jgi:hypothetical protein